MEGGSVFWSRPQLVILTAMEKTPHLEFSFASTPVQPPQQFLTSSSHFGQELLSRPETVTPISLDKPRNIKR